ncbi:PadR family transcriptional regulator [Dactylosporangium matsuzakiense]|uniref:PadR family transcriptional regulator n=1 Tax=Dactylosporangium matsuzakiense TaxID=53360 RepID=A0A9W6KLJ7_9ACTN|nr:PadR family transcriptional regulator [Dactylosporangium matsuzakiense]UWZ44160.1 PadR family transcriptional regulator [Dactylosporangium matsuzakiense]GLL03408.1 PadR family transcriptional regulator [Dactylosporangium matsuzakiense]
MSLRHALLGLLADTPQNGYDLTKRFERTLSGHAWSAGHSQIYPELKRMLGDGLIEVVDEGSRGSKVYGVTDPGRTELRRWMFSPLGDTPPRNEFVLRLFLISSLDLPDVRTLVDQMAAESDEEVTQIDGAIKEMDDAGLRRGYARFAAEFGRRYFALQRDWSRWVLEELEKDD